MESIVACILGKILSKTIEAVLVAASAFVFTIGE